MIFFVDRAENSTQDFKSFSDIFNRLEEFIVQLKSIVVFFKKKKDFSSSQKIIIKI